MKRAPKIPIVPPRIPRIIRLLEDGEMIGEIEDLAATGASLATIDAKLQFPPNTMSKILAKGRIRKKGPYRRFFMMFRSWVAEARHAAEATMAKKSPEKWLDRNSSNKTIESEEDRSLAIAAPSNQGHSPGVSAATILASLKILRDQGISIDEAIDKDDISFAIEDQSK